MLSIIAQWIIVTERFGRVSKSGTSRRCGTIHPNVRSTAHCFGRVRNVPKVADRLVYPQALLRASGPPPRDDRSINAHRASERSEGYARREVVIARAYPIM